MTRSTLRGLLDAHFHQRLGSHATLAFVVYYILPHDTAHIRYHFGDG